MTFNTPVQSIAYVAPPFLAQTSLTFATTSLASFASIMSEHPNSFASPNFPFCKSTPTTCSTPNTLAAITAASPTPPNPNTTTLSPLSGFNTFNTVPGPGRNPHPIAAYHPIAPRNSHFTTLFLAKLECPKY